MGTRVLRIAAISLLASSLTIGAQAQESFALTDVQLDVVTAGLQVTDTCSSTGGICTSGSSVGSGSSSNGTTVVIEKEGSTSRSFSFSRTVNGVTITRSVVTTR